MILSGPAIQRMPSPGAVPPLPFFPMSIAEAEITFRAGRGLRSSPYLFMGIILAICLGIALYALDMAHGHMGTENVTIMVVTLLGVVAFGGWLTILTAGGYLGATTLREDGLLIAKPRRGSQH